MLGLVEETILLMLRDEGGSFLRLPTPSQRFAIAGAVLMALADANRIDTDRQNLVLVDGTPTGDDLLDPTLAEIVAGERKMTRDWIDYVAERTDVIRAGAIGRLLGKSILTTYDKRILWVFRTRRYPVVDSHAYQEFKLHLTEVLLSDGTPDPRDARLICLADACRITRTVLPRRKQKNLRSRIERVAGLDLIGQTMLRAIGEVRGAVTFGGAPG